MKKCLSILLSLCILLTAITVLPLTAFAQETDLAASGETEGGFEYSVEDGEAAITTYTGFAA